MISYPHLLKKLRPAIACLVIITGVLLAPLQAQAQQIVPDALKASLYGTGFPSYGNPNGVTIVEFFDYQCGYCKSSEDGVQQLLNEDPNIQVVYVDFPKLGPMSILAAKFALAALHQDPSKYFPLRSILMRKDVQVSQNVLMQSAQYVGLNMAQLNQDVANPALDTQIQNNIALGQAAGVTVTPSFIIGGRFYAGYASYLQLKERILYARVTHQYR